jgi:terminase small subunit-like protein
MTKDKPLSRKHQMFIAEYLKSFNGTRAYMQVYKNASYETAMANAAKLLGNTKISAAVDERKNMVLMQADEAFRIVTEIADGDMGVFWKVVDEWMFHPLPEYEILDSVEVIVPDTDPPEKRISYRVRHVVLDMDKIIDPQYSHLVQEFSNSRRSGLRIKTYSKHEAARDILKIHGKFIDKHELTGKDGEPLLDENIIYDRVMASISSRLEKRQSARTKKDTGESNA